VTTIDNWFARNLLSLKTVVRIIFGVFWAIDGALKFDPGFVNTFPNMIKDAASGQPSWLTVHLLVLTSYFSLLLNVLEGFSPLNT
jgi:hypothetical protein